MTRTTAVCGGLHLITIFIALVLLVNPVKTSSSSDIQGLLRWMRPHQQDLDSSTDSLHTTDGSKAPDFTDGDDDSIKAHWALVVAGSSGWGNYRHQADACHAYQVLRRGGLRPERIVTMMFDDIAHNRENPKSGKIFNSPDGPDVYNGIHIDYRGASVNSQTFLAVLEGDQEGVRNVPGSGKVIKSGPRDRVFVFYSDHGSPGVLGMPSGDFLYADQLLASLKRKRKAGGYKEVTMYIEACESGSMFEGLLGPELGVYVTTAANAFESSWGTYCPGMDPGPGAEFDTCLGDLYSVAWMENSETEDLRVETLKAQFDYMASRTSNNFTYIMGSHVMQYGAVRIEGERAGDYIGMYNTGAPRPLVPASERQQVSRRMGLERSGSGSSRHWLLMPELERQQQRQRQQRPVRHVAQREADLVHLRHRAAHGKDAATRAAAQAELDAEVARRRAVDDAARAAAAALAHVPGAGDVMMGNLGLISMPGDLPEQLVSASMGRPGRGLPLVDSWDCLRDMVSAWEAACGRMDQYAMRHTRLFANMCNAGLNGRALTSALGHAGACSAPGAGPEPSQHTVAAS